MDRHCDANGHTRAICFKLHGYPDRSKDLKTKKYKSASKAIANLEHTSFDREQDYEKLKDREALDGMIHREVFSYMKGEATKEENYVNFHIWETLQVLLCIMSTALIHCLIILGL